MEDRSDVLLSATREDTQFNREQRDLETFSGRLNALIDLTGKFVSLADGRVAQLAKKMGASRAGVHLWLNSNITPHRKQLAILVESLLISINANVSLESVMAWLDYGSAVPNPFVNSLVPDNTEIAAIVTAVLSQARKLGMSLISESDSNVIAQIAVSAALNPRYHHPDPALIESLLRKYIDHPNQS
jgi:hypothetical protein